MSELTPEDSERVAEIRRALEQEFSEGAGSTAKAAIKEIEDLKEDALIALRHTIKHSDNENLKTKVSMWAMDKLLERDKKAEGDIYSFLEEMNAASSSNP